MGIQIFKRESKQQGARRSDFPRLRSSRRYHEAGNSEPRKSRSSREAPAKKQLSEETVEPDGQVQERGDKRGGGEALVILWNERQESALGVALA